jgi:hypothetical protein
MKKILLISLLVLGMSLSAQEANLNLTDIYLTDMPEWSKEQAYSRLARVSNSDDTFSYWTVKNIPQMRGDIRLMCLLPFMQIMWHYSPTDTIIFLYVYLPEVDNTGAVTRSFLIETVIDKNNPKRVKWFQ